MDQFDIQDNQLIDETIDITEKKEKTPRDRLQQFRRLIVRFADEDNTRNKERYITIRVSSIDKIANHIRTPKKDKPVLNSNINKYTVFNTSFNPIVGVPSKSVPRIPTIPKIPVVDEHGTMTKALVNKNTIAIFSEKPTNIVKICDYVKVFTGKDLNNALRKEMNAWWSRLKHCKPFISYMDKTINEYKQANNNIYEIDGLIPLSVLKKKIREEKKAQQQAVPPIAMTDIQPTPAQPFIAPTLETPQPIQPVVPIQHIPTSPAKSHECRPKNAQSIQPVIPIQSVVQPISVAQSSPTKSRGRKRQPKNTQSSPALALAFTAPLPNLTPPTIPELIDFKLEGDDNIDVQPVAQSSSAKSRGRKRQPNVPLPKLNPSTIPEVINDFKLEGDEYKLSDIDNIDALMNEITDEEFTFE